jgi:uncharacterized protein YfaS (alpha-2-macroglobulin family)
VHALAVRLEGDTAGVARRVTASATVTDGAGRSWTSPTAFVLHPASLAPGLRAVRRWSAAGAPIEVDVVAVDLGGAARTGVRVEVAAVARRWDRLPGGWAAIDSAVGACTLTTAAAPVRCAIPAGRPGEHVLTARLRDARGRASVTELHTWVAGGAGARPGEEGATLEADRAEYRPGDTAHVLLTLPFAPARGIVTVERDTLRHAETFRAATPTHVVRVPIPPGAPGDVTVRVDAAPAVLPDTARGGSDAWVTVSRTLPVPPRARALRVSAVPRDTVAEPGDTTRVEVEVRDAAGRPVAAAVVVVDEAVLALVGHGFADPLPGFHPSRRLRTSMAMPAPFVAGPPVDHTPAPGTVVGRVTEDDTGRPVAGAAVRVAGRDATTDALGRFRFAGVPAGTHRLQVLAPAEAEGEVRVDARPVPPVELRITMAVRDPWGSHLRGGGIALLDALAVTGAGIAAEPAAGTIAGIAMRHDFRALAAFAPRVRTGPDGRASVPVALPGSLTRFRVVAVATADSVRSGVGQGSLRVRRRLSVRPSPPRFLHLGDRFTLPVVVENGDTAAVDVVVAARGAGVALDSAAWRVRVPAGGSAAVRLAGRAELPGEARIQVAVSGGGRSDAAEVSLPVWTPGAPEVVATYGTLDDDAPVSLPVVVPPGAFRGLGGLEISATSTALGELTEAYLYLRAYPYECTEQVASRLLATVAMHDVLPALHPAGMPSAEAVRAAVARDLAILAERQRPSGAFGFWTAESRVLPFASLHAAHAVVRAHAAEGRPSEDPAEEYFAPPPGRLAALRAYALYVRALDTRAMDDARGAIAAFARSEGVRGLGVESAALLLSALADETAAHAAAGTGAGGDDGLDGDAPEDRDAYGDPRTLRRALLRRVTGAATETAATAAFTARDHPYDWFLFSSSGRTDAAALDALLAADPRNELVAKAVRGLMARRRAGRWASTQENAWVLLALARYFRTFEAAEPAFVSRVWVGERLAGEHAFRGRTADAAASTCRWRRSAARVPAPR